jgi:hypothetical protein
LTDEEKKQVCMSNLSNFVYREGYKNNSWIDLFNQGINLTSMGLKID